MWTPSDRPANSTPRPRPTGGNPGRVIALGLPGPDGALYVEDVIAIEAATAAPTDAMRAWTRCTCDGEGVREAGPPGRERYPTCGECEGAGVLMVVCATCRVPVDPSGCADCEDTVMEAPPWAEGRE